MFGLKDAIALLVIAFVSYQIGIFCIYLKDTKCCRNITIPSSAIMYRANMGPINNVEAAFVKLEQDGYNVRRSDRTACSPTCTIGF